MRKTRLKPAKKPKRRTKPQRKAIELVEDDPLASDREISRKMINLGLVKTQNYLNRSMRDNVDLASEIAILRERGVKKVLKRVPKAVKVVDKHLTDNSLRAAELVIKMILGYDETRRAIIPIPIHIDQIQVLMQNIQSEALKKVKENNKLEGE